MSKFINYEEKSDYDINLMFLKVIAQKKGWPENLIVGHPHDADKRSVGVCSEDQYYWFDFCNCVNDTFQYIINEGLTMILLEDDRWMAITRHEGAKVPRYHAYHEKYLRAAVTALIQQEVK